MGNTASTERVSSRSKNEVITVKPPSDWNHHTEAQKFVVVSPQSDISNPSQFRHYHNRKPAATTSKTPMRKRSSKVISKGLPHPQHPPMTTDLPAPEAFFFDPSSSGTEPVHASMESSNKMQQQRNLHQTVKAKATRAKQLLKGCWKDQKEAMEGCFHGAAEEAPVQHQRFASMSPNRVRKYRQSNMDGEIPPYGSAKGPQFIPDIEDEGLELNRTLSPRHVYLHDEESYIQRMVDDTNERQASETPLMTKKDVRNMMSYPSSGSVDDGEQSPVTKLFERRHYSEGCVNQKDKRVRQSCPDELMATDEPKRPPNTIERNVQKQVDEQVRLQFESKSEEIGRVKRLRESYLQKLEETKRLSVEEEQRRESLGSNALANGGRVVGIENTTRKLQEVPIEEEDEKEPFDEPQEHSRPAPFDEDKENFEKTNCVMWGRGRHSAPVLRPNPMNVEKTGRKSEPNLRNKENYSSEDGHLPILLKIAGWEKVTNSAKPKREEETDQNLPSLLELASWKQAANQKKPRSSVSRSIISSKDVKNNAAQSVEPYKLEAKKEDRAINQAASRYSYSSRSEDDDARIPLPFGLQSTSSDEPKETPVVKKMSRMLLATQSVAEAFGEEEKNHEDRLVIPLQDLSESIETVATPCSQSSHPMVAEDALVNAAFLFSPSYVDNKPSLLRLGGGDETKSSTSTTISTLDSRNRCLLPSYFAANMGKSMQESAPKNYQTTSTGCYKDSSSNTASSKEQKTLTRGKSALSSSTSTASHTSSSRSTDSSNRRVRFSIGNQIVVPSAKKEQKTVRDLAKSPLKNDDLMIPRIEHKLSDLTDIFSHERDSLTTVGSNRTAETVKEALEEVPAESGDDASPITSHKQEDNEEPSPPSTWAYSVDLDNGVTPLRSGRGGGNTNKTNSPHKRFNEAKSRFGVKKASPVKRASPVKPRPSKISRTSAGLVHARVAAMEHNSQKATATQPKTRRDTTAYKAIAPRKTNLKSPHFQPRTSVENDLGEAINRPTPQQTQQTVKTKSSLDNVKSLKTTKPAFERNTDSTSNDQDVSNSDSESEMDDFNMIRKTSTMDEDDRNDAKEIFRDMMKAKNSVSIASHSSASTDFDGDDDDFAALLQYQASIDEGDSDNDMETVSTIQRTRSSLGSNMSGDTAPTVVRRSSVVSGSTAPTIARRSSVNSGGTAPTVARHEHSNTAQALSTINRSSSFPYGKRLPFREEALVRPTEQSHRTAPGTLCLSPMQRTPMQAMKWRALAAAAAKNESESNVANSKKPAPRRSLAERNPNLMGNRFIQN